MNVSLGAKTAHSFESKQRTEDVKIEQDDLTFTDLHLSSHVLAGKFWLIQNYTFNKYLRVSPSYRPHKSRFFKTLSYPAGSCSNWQMWNR